MASSIYPLRRASTTAATTTPATKPTCVARSENSGEPNVYSVFEDATSTWQYVIADPATNKAVIIDPVLDYSPTSGVVGTKTADGLLVFIKEKNLDVIMLLETHAHADHLTSAQYLKKRLGGSVPVAIGKRIRGVQERFGNVYGVPGEWMTGAFDKYWEDDDTFDIGELKCQVVHLPGHTPDHVGYRCGKGLFLGDTLFYPDVGTARADFPGGSPVDLYQSIQRVLSLGPDVRLYAGHDYPPQGACHPQDRCWSLVQEQLEKNVHLKATLTSDVTSSVASISADQENAKNSFVSWRAQRDNTLGAPRLLHPALQINICGGRPPKPDESGRRVIKIPVQIPDGL